MPSIPALSPNVPAGAAFAGRCANGPGPRLARGPRRRGGPTVVNNTTNVTTTTDPWLTRQQAEQGAVEAVLAQVIARDARFADALARMMVEQGFKRGV